MLERSPYLGLVSSVCQVFDSLQYDLIGRCFTSEQTSERSGARVACQPSQLLFISEGIQKLVFLWTVCVENKGDTAR